MVLGFVTLDVTDGLEFLLIFKRYGLGETKGHLSTDSVTLGDKVAVARVLFDLPPTFWRLLITHNIIFGNAQVAVGQVGDIRECLSTFEMPFVHCARLDIRCSAKQRGIRTTS